MLDFDRTIISQYANSAILTTLIENMNQWIDPRVNLEAFYNLIWNVDTAEGYGLDVWGRIVGINRVLQVRSSKFFGWQEGGSASYDPWGGPGSESDGTGWSPWFADEFFYEPYTLTDQQYRTLIFAKALSNICDSSIPVINQMLMNLFPNRGNAWVTDDHPAPEDRWFTHQEQGPRAWGWDQQAWGDFAEPRAPTMKIVYTFDFPLEDFEVAIVMDSGVLPKPTAVLADISRPYS